MMTLRQSARLRPIATVANGCKMSRAVLEVPEGLEFRVLLKNFAFSPGVRAGRWKPVRVSILELYSKLL